MLNVRMTKYGMTVLAALLVTLAGCGQGSDTDTDTAPEDAGATGNGSASATSPDGLPADFVLASMPEDTRDVAEAKDAVKPGDQIAIRGRIGGSAEPFIDGRAAFTIVDRSLKACSDIPGDMCKRPWDYCCEPKDSLARNTATITVVDDTGHPLPMSMHGKAGLEELTDVVVVGKVAQAEGNVLLVNARGVYLTSP